MNVSMCATVKSNFPKGKERGSRRSPSEPGSRWRALFVSLLFLSPAAWTDDFPTVEVVGNVLNCMSEHGGQSVENLYACACRLDYIAGQMDFETFDQAATFERYRRMPGEKGGIFRENEEAEDLVSRLQKVRAEAARRCPLVKRVATPATDS